MLDNNAASETSIVSRNRVTDAVRMALHIAVNVERRFTLKEIEEHSKVKLRALRSYMATDPTEVREPTLSSALSIAVVLGPRAINGILAIIGYSGARPLDEDDAEQPSRIVATCLDGLNVIARAAADNHFDHTEKPDVRKAADSMIATLIPVSSAGEAA